MSPPPKARPTISVLVPTLNRHDDWLEFLPSLVAQTQTPLELVVVDAGQDPRIEPLLRAGLAGSGIDLQYARSEAGTSLQRNKALDMVRGEFVFMFDDDTVLEPDYIERTMECFSLPYDPPVGCVLGSFKEVRSRKGPVQHWYRLFRLSHSVFGNQAGTYASGGFVTLKAPTEVVQVPVASGGRTAYRRACFDEERFAEFLPGYTMSEDVEVSWRVGKQWTIVHTPHARMHHKVSPSNRLRAPEIARRHVYSRYFFFSRHMPKKPTNLAAFAWANVGLGTWYMASAVARGTPGPTAMAKGLLTGYKLCWDDWRGKLPPVRSTKSDGAGT